MALSESVDRHLRTLREDPSGEPCDAGALHLGAVARGSRDDFGVAKVLVEPSGQSAQVASQDEAALPETATGVKRARKGPKVPKAPKAPKPPNPCLGAEIITQVVPDVHYGIKLPFTPSNAQLLRYALAKGHKLVMNYKALEPAPTFDDDALRKLREWYPEDQLYPLVDRYRETEKCLGTYVQGITMRPDGRVGGEFSHKPRTLRLAMSNPNHQNQPRGRKDSPYTKVKGMYRAADGYGFCARDFSGIEAVLVGYLAADRDLLRLAGGVIQDVHGFIATTAIGKPPDLKWSDADLQGYLKEFRKEDREWNVNGRMTQYTTLRTGCKRSLYLSIFGGTPPRMVQAEPEIFPTTSIAAWYQELFFSTFPKVQKWQWDVCEEAEEKGYVLTPDGFRQHFSEVFTYTYSAQEAKWLKKYGPVAKEVMAAKPQHLGFIFSALAMVALRNEYPEVHEGLRLSIHDELLGEYPLHFREEADSILKSVMERPCRCLPLPAAWNLGTHLKVATEAKMSKPDAQGIHRWGSM